MAHLQIVQSFETSIKMETCKDTMNRVYNCVEFEVQASFPLDRKVIVKSCDSSKFWLIVETIIKDKNLT